MLLLKKIGKDGPEKYIHPNGQLNKEGMNLLAPLAKKIIISSVELLTLLGHNSYTL